MESKKIIADHIVTQLNPSPTEQTIFTLSYLSNINGQFLVAANDQSQADGFLQINLAGGTYGDNFVKLNPGYFQPKQTKDKKGTEQKSKIRPGVKGALDSLLDNKWECVWGPYSSNSMLFYNQDEKKEYYVTDNAMYLARYKGGDPNYIGPGYVLAVAGTNGLSTVGWLGEDFDVIDETSWPPIYLTNPQTDDSCSKVSSSNCNDQALISYGTCQGLKTLWELGSEDGNTILDYVTSKHDLIKNEGGIVVTGHSLGGALSPVMALALSQAKGLTDIKISAMPTAGPTPGNAKLADQLAQNLNEYNAIYNAIDVVPHAWEMDQLAEVPKLYADDGINKKGENSIIKNLFSVVTAQASGKCYERLPDEDLPANFSVKTFSNQFINGAHHSIIEEIFNTLSHLINGKIKVSGEMLRLFDNLRKIAGNLINLGLHFKGFTRFFTQLLSQHTTAYTDAKQDGFQLSEGTMDTIRNSTMTNFPDNILTNPDLLKKGGIFVLVAITDAVVKRLNK